LVYTGATIEIPIYGGLAVAQENEEKAVSAYTKFLQAKDVDAEAIALRSKFIKNLSILLKGKSSRADYGMALAMIAKLEDKITPNQQLNIAREFYPFWINDIKMIAAMSESYGYDLSAIQFKPVPSPLEWETIEQLNGEVLSVHEDMLLKRYSTNLQAQKMAESAIQEKVRLAKILLLRLRDIPIQNNLVYRMAIDVTLPLFNLEDLKLRFLQAVREFFYVWIDKTGSSDAIA